MSRKIIKKVAEQEAVTGPILYPPSFKRREDEGPNSARLRFEIEFRAGQHRHPEPDAFPSHARPCEGKFLKNGDFHAVSGRHHAGPLCKVCGGLADVSRCMACGALQ